MIRNGKTYYFVLDYLGSVRAVVDVVSGMVEQEIDYDTFGQVLSDSNPGYQPFGFAGGLYDHETKLVRFGARDYDALTGRWTAPDPIGFNGGQFNLYVYSNSDSVNYVDPNGQAVFTIGLLIAFMVGANLGLFAYAKVTPRNCRRVLGALGWSLGGGIGVAGFFALSALVAGGAGTFIGAEASIAATGLTTGETFVWSALLGPTVGPAIAAIGYSTSVSIGPARSMTLSGVKKAAFSGGLIGTFGLFLSFSAVGIVGTTGLPFARVGIGAASSHSIRKVAEGSD